MKHEKIPSTPSGTLILDLSDEQIETRAFSTLEAKQAAWEKARADAVVIFRHPENCSFYQRLATWWYLRKRRSQPVAYDQDGDAMAEPIWQGHWASTKYL